jgi:ELWxxDGT repeat protein
MRRVGDRLFVTAGSPTALAVLRDGESVARRIEPLGVSGFFVGSGDFSSVGDRLIFQGCDDAHGCELWGSDGTDAGTRLLHDLLPGPTSSDPDLFAETAARLFFVADDGIHSSEPWTLRRDTDQVCVATSEALCLEGGRFQATAFWTDFAGRSGDAAVVPITGDTGAFWFFEDDNLEVVLKVIDGTGTNHHHWVYYGALTNLQYTMTIADAVTGAARRYFNPAARFASSGDIRAFGPDGAHVQGGRAVTQTVAGRALQILDLQTAGPMSASGSCVPSANRFCILEGRFAVEATWRDFAGETGLANASNLTDDTGYLWFFDNSIVEVVLKAVDGSDLNGHFWIYFGALSNVEYTITVTDTVTGLPRVYRNVLGNFASFGDIEAFPAP